MQKLPQFFTAAVYYMAKNIFIKNMIFKEIADV